MAQGIIGTLKAVDWKKAALIGLAGAAGAAAGFYTKKKTGSTPMALAAAGATTPAVIFITWYAMDKLGYAGLEIETMGGLVMEQVGYIPELRSRSAMSDYRGLVMEQVAGCGYGRCG